MKDDIYIERAEVKKMVKRLWEAGDQLELEGKYWKRRAKQIEKDLLK